MTEPEQNKKPLAFDEIHLHTDVNVHELEAPPVKREPPADRGRRSGGKAVWVWFLLFLLAAAGTGWLYKQNLDLRKAQNELEAQVNQAAANLESTTTSLLETKSYLENTKGNLQQTSGTLQDAQKNIDRLQDGLKKAQAEGAQQREENAKVTADLNAERTALKKEKAERERIEKDLAAAQRQAKQAAAERDEAKRHGEQVETDLAAKILTLETRLTDNQATYLKQLKAVESERDKLRDESNRANRELERMQQQFKDESSASLQIIEERSALKKENDDLKRRSGRLETDLGNARERIASLEKVSLGDLVPFSPDVTPASINYREPLPEGVKIPKKLGQVVVMALITEVGAVESAFPVPGQELDATLAAAISRTVYKWKFTPPTHSGVRVKTWHPLLLTSP